MSCEPQKLVSRGPPLPVPQTFLGFLGFPGSLGFPKLLGSVGFPGLLGFPKLLGSVGFPGLLGFRGFLGFP
eukprot:1209901-Pyramimonas_sp.AAC.1